MILQHNDEICISVIVVKTEKNHKIIYGENISILLMGNQQGSLE